MTHYIKFDGISGTSGNSSYIGYCKVYEFQDDESGNLWFRMSFAKGSGPLLDACATGNKIASALMVNDEEGSVLLKTRYTNLLVMNCDMSKKGNAFGLAYEGSVTDYPQWSSE